MRAFGNWHQCPAGLSLQVSALPLCLNSLRVHGPRRYYLYALYLLPPFFQLTHYALSPSVIHCISTTTTAESYFETHWQPPPVTLQHDIERVCEFVERQQREGRNVVLVTVSISTLCYSMNALQLPFSIKSDGTS